VRLGLLWPAKDFKKAKSNRELRVKGVFDGAKNQEGTITSGKWRLSMRDKNTGGA